MITTVETPNKTDVYRVTATRTTELQISGDSLDEAKERAQDYFSMLPQSAEPYVITSIKLYGKR